MKKSSRLLILAGLALGLVSCGSTSSLTISSEASSESSAKTSLAVSSEVSSEEVSSETPAPSSEESSAEVSSSEAPAVETVKTLDWHALGQDWLANSQKETPDVKFTDGFFTVYGSSKNIATGTKNFNEAPTDSVDPAQLKIDGGSSVSVTDGVVSKKGLVEFTVTGGGSITIHIKGGTSNESTRIVYLAKAAEDGSIGEYIDMLPMPLNASDGKASWVASKTDAYVGVIPDAGTYYILENNGCTLDTLSVSYTEGAVKEHVKLAKAPTDPSILYPTELVPGDVAAGTAIGNYTVTGDGAKLAYSGAVQMNAALPGMDAQDTKHNVYNYLQVSEANSITFTGSLGTLSMYAVDLNSDDDPATTVSATVKNGDTVVSTSVLPVSVKDKGTAAVSFSLEDEATYTITFSGTARIYRLAFAGV
jgi:hypothetical protein